MAWLQAVYFIFEIIIGLWTGSIAVIADALHSLSTVGGVVLSLIAAFISQKGEATPRQTFSRYRAEIIGALFNGLLLLLMAVIVVGTGIYRLISPIAPPAGPMLIAAAGAIITETIAIKLLYREQKISLNVKGAFLHVIQTFLGSFFIIVSAVVIYFTGFIRIDPILAIGFALTLFWMSIRMLKRTVSVLMENVPEELDLTQIIDKIMAVKGTKGVHHIHLWSLTSSMYVFMAHILVDDYQQGQRIQNDVHKLLKDEYNVYFSTIQIERECPDKGSAEAIDITE
ncbi:Cobalt-zinc-cadmium resistance protein CzcD [Chitinispirillum alkaliphilum]|nr:Cobalt-zinc-cadmium resistance protein CzcD [Chitinispirillum alkaliphilum]